MIMHSAVWDESDRRTDEREFIWKQLLTTDNNWHHPTRTFYWIQRRTRFEPDVW